MEENNNQEPKWMRILKSWLKREDVPSEDLNTSAIKLQEVKMVKEDNVDFEMDEEKALKEAFEEARKNNKLFNVNSWKLKREKQRAKLNLPVSNG